MTRHELTAAAVVEGARKLSEREVGERSDTFALGYLATLLVLAHDRQGPPTLPDELWR